MSPFFRGSVGIAFIALGLPFGCAGALAPTATALLPSVSNPPLSPMKSAAIPGATTALRVKRTTTGSPDRNVLTSVICGHPPLELASQVNAVIDEGGAVRFDKGLIVKGDARALAMRGVVGIISANGLAAYVCAEDLEREER